MKRPKRQPTPKPTCVVVVCESRNNPGTFVLFRQEADDHEHYHVWCGKLGWLIGTAFAHRFKHVFHSEEEAEEAARKLALVPAEEADFHVTN